MITIIVLLILAGVSVATLTGENGLLTKAGDAKEETRGTSVEEARDLWKINQEADNRTESTTAQTLEELLNDLENQKLITAEERTTIEQTGEVTIGSKTIVFKTIEILAGDVLKTDSTATDAAAKSPYVTYNGLTCRVLYNDDTHGLQIITADSVETVTLGSGDTMDTSTGFSYGGSGADASESVSIGENFRKAAASYNNVVDNLNNKAKTYMDSKGIVTDARSLGSIPTLNSSSKFQGDTSGMWSGAYGYLTTYGWNNKFKTADDNYTEDVKQLNGLGLNVSSEYTWLASRNVYSDSSDTDFLVRRVNSSGSMNNLGNLCGVNSGGAAYSSAPSYGFRPVFLLPSDVVISGGDGSSGNPYIIE